MPGFRLSVFKLSMVLCLFLLPAQSLWAQGAPPVLRPEPAVLEIGQGQVETVSIVLENAQEVYAIDVQASFDPAVVEVVDATRRAMVCS